MQSRQQAVLGRRRLQISKNASHLINLFWRDAGAGIEDLIDKAVPPLTRARSYPDDGRSIAFANRLLGFRTPLEIERSNFFANFVLYGDLGLLPGFIGGLEP